MIASILSGGIAPAWLWEGFFGVIILLLVADLLLFHKEAHEVKTKEAILFTSFWISLALGFNLWFGFTFGYKAGMEFLTGYLIEKSLSLDNIFVMYLVFSSLKIPASHQHRVLFWGIFGAIILRGIMILAGASLVTHFHWVLYIFGAILLYSAWKFIQEEVEEIDAQHHWAVKVLSRFIRVSPRIHGQHFFVKENGHLMATPLLVGLVLVEVSDIIFAVDSIPAVFAITTDPFIAFASNIMAILGLRALYFVIAVWIKSMRYLKPGLAVLLGFVGLKMIVEDIFHIPIWVSLLVIVAILTTATAGSWYANKMDELKKGRGKQK